MIQEKKESLKHLSAKSTDLNSKEMILKKYHAQHTLID